MRPWWYLLGVAVVSGVFALAGVAKLSDPQAFQESIQQLVHPDWRVSALIAVVLPCLELGLAGALWVPRMRRGALWQLLVLVVAFLVVLVPAWWSGTEVVCSCFGSWAAYSTGVAIVIDGVLLVSIPALLWADRSMV